MANFHTTLPSLLSLDGDGMAKFCEVFYFCKCKSSNIINFLLFKLMKSFLFADVLLFLGCDNRERVWWDCQETFMTRASFAELLMTQKPSMLDVFTNEFTILNEAINE